jgi:hypothetical protein
LSWKFDIVTGGLVAGLTWSFFVLCTPVADAGFLLDFPIRLIFGFKMLITEIAVWVFALVLNFYILIFNPEIYQTTLITSLFYKILVTPWPYWGIVIMCGIGTFLSVYFADEMLDVISHKEREKYHQHGFKYKIAAMVSIFAIVIVIYQHLLGKLGVLSFF